MMRTEVVKPSRVPRGFLKYGILEVLAIEPRNGYEIIQELEARGGRPSAGSVYPALGRIVDDGYATVSQNDTKRLYKITKAGLKVLVDRPRPHGKYSADDLKSLLAVKDTSKKLTQAVRAIARDATADQRRQIRRVLDEAQKRLMQIR